MKDNIYLYYIALAGVIPLFVYLSYRFGRRLISLHYRDEETLAYKLWIGDSKCLRNGEGYKPLKRPEIKIRSKKGTKFIILKKYNKNLSEQFLTSKTFMADLGNLYGLTIATVEKRHHKYKQPEFVYTTVNKSKFELKKQKGKAWFVLLGRMDNLNLVWIDLRKYFALRIVGSGGSGKSVLLSSILEVLARGLNGDLSIIFATAKRPEDDPALSHLYNSKKVEWYDLNNIEDILSFNKKIEKIHRAFSNDIHDREIYKNTVITLEEASQYLTVEKTDPAELKKEKSRLISNIRKHIKLMRFTGIPVIVVTQGASEDEIDIPKSLFKLIISGKMLKGISLSLTGDANFLQDDLLTNGRFGVSIEGNLIKLQAPILESPEDNSKFCNEKGY